MAITSVDFVLFFVFGILAYYICPVKHRWLVLLASSVCFYLISGIEYFPFIVFTTLTIWLASREIGKIWKKQEEYFHTCNVSSEQRKARKKKDKEKARIVLVVTLCINIGFLVFGKLVNYFVCRVSSTNSLFTNVIVPLGISYYTFTTVGYLLDVYWKRYTYEKNFVRFSLYSLYYPHIVQGPISRYNTLGQELLAEHRFSFDNLTKGAELILWGYFKKLVIADRLNIFVSNVFSDPIKNGSIYTLAIFFDVIQIYADFSGYMDVVCGISQIYGIKLEQNFNHPFFSKSVTEFWRRWHMTLGGWFKDYVYYPLTVSKWLKSFRKKIGKLLPTIAAQFIVTAIPIMITWILTGLWHGTGAGYLSWGIYYGTLITISVVGHDAFIKLGKRLHIRMNCFSWRLFQMIRTFVIFAGGRLLTKGSSLGSALQIIRRIFFGNNIGKLFDGSLFYYGLNQTNLVIAFSGALLLLLVSNIQNKCNIREKLGEQNIVFRWSILLLGIFCILVYGVYGSTYSTSGFMYQQF